MAKSRIFKAYDIRGIYGVDFEDADARQIGQAFATINPGRVVIGSDARMSSPGLKRELISGLREMGVDVVDIGLCATPMIVFAIKHLKLDGGIMVTASHNPKQYNGFKFFDSSAIPVSYDSGLDKLKNVFFSRKLEPAGRQGRLEKTDIGEDYAEFLISKLNFTRPVNMKVVVDTANSSPGTIYPYVLRKAGAEVVGLFTEVDGNFPNHHPNPSRAENLVALQKRVVDEKADLGFAYDGDGDRLAVVDSNGETVYCGTVFSIFIQDCLEKKPKSKVVMTVIDSQAIDDTIKTLGGQPVVCRVGHTFISQKMITENAALAGEISGHYYFDETFKGDDALFASLKLIECMTNSGKTIKEYESEFPRYFSEVSEKMRFPIKESEKFPFIEQLKNEMRSQGYDVNDIDGVKVFMEDGWALFRPSNTEPKISIAFEAQSKRGFEKVKEFVDGVIERIPKE